MKKIYLIVILCALAANSGVTAAPAESESIIKNLDNSAAQKHILDNGLTLIIKEDHTSPLVAVKALVNVGGAGEGEFSGSGISHLAEHMLFKGTKRRKRGRIENEIKSFGGTIGGFTSHDYTGYEILVPKKYLAGALDILGDALFNSSVDPKEFEKEKDVILKEIKLNRDKPSRFLSRQLWATAFRRHPYRYPVIGHENIFKNLTRPDVLKFYKKMYVPNNIILVVAGDADKEGVYKEVMNVFGKAERGSLPDIERPEEPRQISKRILEKRDAIHLAYFGFGFRGVDIASPDLFALDVLAMILGSGASSRLNQELYREKELVYSIGSWNYTPGDPGLFIISGVTEAEKVDDALEAIDAEINKLKENNVKEKELVKAKNTVLTGYISSRETVSGQANDLAVSEAVTGDYNFSRHYLEGINSVEADDIKKAARNYLKEESLTVVTLLPEGADIKSAVGSEKEVIRHKIQKHELPNGMRVLLKENHRLPLVSIRAVFTGGLRTEQEEENGTSNLMAAMLLKGTDSMTEEEISETIESAGGSIGCMSGNNSFGVSMDLLAKDLDKGLGILMDIFTSSNFHPGILEREKNAVLAAIKSEEDDIYQFSVKLIKENIFKSHPYRMRVIGNTDSVSKLDRASVHNYYKSWCRPNNMVLAVFGDIDPARTLAGIKDKFREFGKADLPALTVPEDGRIKEKNVITRELDKAQSVVMIGFRGTTVYNNDKYTLAVISSILSGKGGRLSQSLREKLGMAYTLGSFSAPGVDPGYYLFYVGTSLENVPTVKKELLGEIKKLTSKPVTDEEIKSAKSELIGTHEISLQTNSSMAFQAALDELYGLGYDDYLNFPAHVESVTKAEVLEAAKKYFDPEAYTMVVIEGR